MINFASEGIHLIVELSVESVQAGQVILDALEQIISAVAEVDQSVAIVDDLVIGIFTLPSGLDVPLGEFALCPAGGQLGGQFFIEGNAGDYIGGDIDSIGLEGRGGVNELVGVGALLGIENPDIPGASIDSSSCVGVQVELLDGEVGIIIGEF